MRAWNREEPLRPYINYKQSLFCWITLLYILAFFSFLSGFCLSSVGPITPFDWRVKVLGFFSPLPPQMSDFDISPLSRSQLLMFILTNQSLAFPHGLFVRLLTPSPHQGFRNTNPQVSVLYLAPSSFTFIVMRPGSLHQKCTYSARFNPGYLLLSLFLGPNPPVWNVSTNSTNIL